MHYQVKNTAMLLWLNRQRPHQRVSARNTKLHHRKLQHNQLVVINSCLLYKTVNKYVLWFKLYALWVRYLQNLCLFQWKFLFMYISCWRLEYTSWSYKKHNSKASIKFFSLLLDIAWFSLSFSAPQLKPKTVSLFDIAYNEFITCIDFLQINIACSELYTYLVIACIVVRTPSIIHP